MCFSSWNVTLKMQFGDLNDSKSSIKHQLLNLHLSFSLERNANASYLHDWIHSALRRSRGPLLCLGFSCQMEASDFCT